MLQQIIIGTVKGRMAIMIIMDCGCGGGGGFLGPVGAKK